MCGIAGFVTSRPGDPQSTIVERMTTVLEHRGPDAFGYHQDTWAHLGHRRLSIIDLSSGQQPMTNEDRSLWIVYNGEIFNHASVRPELEQAGHRYRSHCDTETILHAYEEFGPDCVKRFRGMFAFALWDQNRRTLFCARDRMGIKPFYYYWDGRLFAFASEIKALLQHPEIRTKFEDTLLPEYLAFGYTSGDQTLFAGIRKLMPGHHLTLELAGDTPRLTIKQYWDVPEAGAAIERDDASWIAELRQRLEETVRMRLMSDVPLGVFLSGGIDSSLIAALMRGMVADQIKTFSVGYAEAPYSELGYAAEVARTLDTDHHEVRVSMDDFFGALPRLIWHEDEPIAWPSSVSLYFVSRLASREVKVVLTGEGSDELFGGYGRYGNDLRNERHMSTWRMAPAWLRDSVRRGIQTTPLLSADLRRKVGHTVLGREDSVASLLLDNFYGPFSKDQRARLHAEPTGAAYQNYLRYFDARPNGSRLSRVLYADQKTYLVELLMKQDQMSMAASIESRVPLLDHTLVEFAASVPDHLKIRNGTAKYILKKAAEGLVPDDIIHRNKMGFPTPVKQWLKDPRADRFYTLLRDPNRLLAAHLDGREIDRLIERHRSGQEDCTDRLWNLLNLQIWGDLFLLGKQDEWQSSEAALAPA
jgi:asparagine synthase (glutamine-hydrolysing)